MIPVNACKDRMLYRLRARNISIGVYRAATNGFLGLRRKFGRTFIDEEHHWDNPEFATAKPLEELPEELPHDIPNTEGLGSFCETCNVSCGYVYWPEGGEREVVLKDGHRMTVPGQWQHHEPTECREVKAVHKANGALFAWLQEMEAKYPVTPIQDYLYDR